MKKSIFLLFIASALVLLPLHSEESDKRHISILQHLIDNHVTHDSITPIDSVILWGQQVSPMLEKEGKTELFFRIRQLLVSLYSQRGEIGRSIDEARQMYEKAEAIHYDLGIALSIVAIGDAYYCSNMPQQAINSYKEAISYPVQHSKNNYYKETAIYNLISLLMKQEKMQEVETYREMLLKLQSESKANPSSQFLTLATDVSYFIRKKNMQKASECLMKIEQIYQSDRSPYLYFIYLYAKGEYNEAVGNYKLALQCYNDILDNITHKQSSIDYLYIAYDKARLLKKMGLLEEAIPVYEEISEITDSVVAPSYAHRINSLRASFQENRMKVENEAGVNRILMGGLLGGFTILGIILFFSWHIRKQNRQIATSKIRLEESQQKLEKAIQTKSLFLSNMSHEIRTPLSAISGFSTLLTDKGLNEETQRQCSEVIQQNSDLLLKLINDVIDLSNLGIGKMKFKLQYCDAISICHNVIDTVNKVKQTQAEVLFKTPLDSLNLYTDDSRLQQLLINLLINSTKFTPSGSITLEVAMQSAHTALFTVSDTGCGIPPEQHSKIFNRFEKLNENAQGTGLGLSICQLIIERIGGKIWIDSEYTAGCRFCFTHPIHPTEQKQ